MKFATFLLAWLAGEQKFYLFPALVYFVFILLFIRYVQIDSEKHSFQTECSSLTEKLLAQVFIFIYFYLFFVLNKSLHTVEIWIPD